MPESDALQGRSPCKLLGSSVSSNELVVGHLEATDLPCQRQGALLVVGAQHMLQDLSVKVGLDVTVALLYRRLHALGPAGICAAWIQNLDSWVGL